MRDEKISKEIKRKNLFLKKSSVIPRNVFNIII